MMHLTLKFLTDEINQYVALKGLIINDVKLQMAAASQIFDTTDTGANSPLDKPIISLVNLEEDRIGRQQEPYTKTLSGVEYRQPPVKLNLYVLFVMNMKDHEKALRWLAAIIQFFQHQPVFTSLSHPALDPAIGQLNAEMMSLSFEQNNQLWSTLGGKYMPSVLYKIRQVTVDEGAITGGGGFIRSITLNERGKQAQP